MWFDTHCHLYELEEQGPLDEVVDRATAAGVQDILCVGVDPGSALRCLELAKSYEGVHAGAAYHPTEAKGWKDSWADAIDELLQAPEVRAVGETGLDLYWDKSYLDDQLRMFASHIALAKKHEKALVIHTRESVGEALDALDGAGAPARVVFHCWSGSSDDLSRALGLGAYISFAGNVSYKNAGPLREAAAAVPRDRLLVETDAPYLAPVPHRGRRNEPAFVMHVGEAVAEARGEEVELVAEQTTANARTVFGV